MALEHLHPFYAKCAFSPLFFLPHRHLSSSDIRHIFMFGTSHKTSSLSLHTLGPLMHLIGAAFALTLFGSFFIFLFFFVPLSELIANTNQGFKVCVDFWKSEQKYRRTKVKVGDSGLYFPFIYVSKSNISCNVNSSTDWQVSFTTSLVCFFFFTAGSLIITLLHIYGTYRCLVLSKLCCWSFS